MNIPLFFEGVLLKKSIYNELGLWLFEFGVLVIKFTLESIYDHEKTFRSNGYAMHSRIV
jgi:hypothetical protein